MIQFYVFIVCLTAASSSYCQDFGSELKLTDDISGIEFSRNPQNNMQVSNDGTLHLVYAIPDRTLPPPNTNIFYQTVSNNQTSAPIKVNSTGTFALHPSLTLDNDGNVHIAWQDARHSTAAGNFIDNIEIYYDFKMKEGSFLDEDIRITNTTANHLGDNGFAPQILTRADGRVHIVWYDFHSNGNNADVYLRNSDENGLFPAAQGIDDFRITSVNNEEGFTSNWLPVLANRNDAIYILWGFQNGFTSFFDIKGMIYNGNINPIESVIDSGGRFLDPPRLASDSMGNLGVVYPAIENNRSIVHFQYKDSTTWNEPLTINQSTLNAAQPDIEFDSNGNAHIVWLEDLGGVFEIHYAEINPGTMSVVSTQIIGSQELDARTPVIGLQPGTDRISIAWMDQRSIDGAALYLIQGNAASVEYWNRWD